MSLSRHGISVGIERQENDIWMSLAVAGKLTHADYELFVPMLEEAINQVKQPQIKVLVDALEFEGWEMRAAWDDFKLGLQHGRQFSKIALLGNKPWEKFAAKLAHWFIGGEARYFENTEEAISWLNE
ncbi:MAG: STAS/SEC14 domain-containing protein [gamma proteobacterium symbiont of Bathyaustriella thionipta]|nr:STAS/SEC14 domain-containing protein [gamma proteobacterium symbiont of Bathyaustriella thionipta]